MSQQQQPLKTDLSSFENKEFDPGANIIVRAIWYYVNLVIFKTGLFPFYGIKSFLLRLFGAKVGKGLVIKPFVNIKYPWKLKIGNHVWIGESVWIDNLEMVTIGNHVCISQGALLLCGNHNYKSSSFDLNAKAINIGDGVWICASAIVCGGVSCTEHSVLAVNSVATKDLDAYSVYQGNPAHKIKDRIIIS